MERILRNRMVRLVTAVGLIGVGLWALLPYATSNVSSSAVVNAELVRLTAPISGRLAAALPKAGNITDTALTLPLIEANALDQRHLADLTQQSTVAAARIDQLKLQLAELADQDRALQERGERHRTVMVERLNAELAEARAEVTVRIAEEEELRRALRRMEQLAAAGHAAEERLDQARSAHQTASARLQAAHARVKRCRTDLAAAADGIFLQDGYNDAPYSQQHRDRLLLRRQDLETELLREQTRLAELTTEIAAERQRLSHLSHFNATLPAGHVVWNLAASAGSAIVEGQPIMDLASCRERFVMVELPERHFDAIRPGDPATVRLIGADETIPGIVRQVRGSGAYADERLLAARLSAPAPRQITVEVALSAAPAAARPGSYCNIGRLAEVRFDSTGPGLFNRLARFTEQLIRSAAAAVRPPS